MQSITFPAEDKIAKARLTWIEPAKAIALLWIFFDHVAERYWGSPLFANPAAPWPPLADRIHQFLTPSSAGMGGIVAAFFRDFAWMGDQGVSVFLILSGFTLAWSSLSSKPAGSWSSFYRRRLLRIYPPWIVAHLLFLFPLAIFGVHLSLLHPRLYLSLLGIRVLPDQLYYGVSAWWFITLLLQLYLVYPLLWNALRKFGALRFACLACGGALLIRAAGLFYFTGYLDAWSRGAIFLTRLPEFAAGMAFAALLADSKTAPNRARLAVIGLGCLLLGLPASFTLLGMAAAPLLCGWGIFLLLYCAFTALPYSRPLDWIGRHSLSLFLVHQLFVRFLIPEAANGAKPLPLLIRFAAALVLTALAAVVLEQITRVLSSLISRACGHWGTPGFLVRAAAAFALVLACLVAGELAVRRRAPIEPFDVGWGERSSLQPDATFGWTMRPNEHVRLRWVTYDYQVESNRYGFPAPAYDPQPSSSVERILVTGDAFTSAEGVDTARSWPRQLENSLKARAIPAQVLNFAITGYGPNQYAAVAKRFIPEFHPNLVLIGLFINDFEDVMTTNATFQESIGFGRPDINSLATVLTFRQLAATVRGQLTKHLFEDALHKPDPDGYVLGQFAQLIAGPDGNVEEGKSALAARLAEIKQVADENHAAMEILLIPSGPQVCQPEALRYWPKHVTLGDPKFDPDLPQRTALSIAGALGVKATDLRPFLKSLPACPYQPLNMHWTEAAHASVAQYLAQNLSIGKKDF